MLGWCTLQFILFLSFSLLLRLVIRCGFCAARRIQMWNLIVECEQEWVTQKHAQLEYFTAILLELTNVFLSTLFLFFSFSSLFISPSLSAKKRARGREWMSVRIASSHNPNFPNPDFIFFFNPKLSVYFPSFIENVLVNSFYCQLLLFTFVCFRYFLISSLCRSLAELRMSLYTESIEMKLCRSTYHLEMWIQTEGANGSDGMRMTSMWLIATSIHSDVCQHCKLQRNTEKFVYLGQKLFI